MTNKFDDDFEGWKRYADQTRGRPPRPLLRRALEFVMSRRAALDIGSGALNDTRFLLQEGFESVTALDGEPVSETIADGLPPARFTYRIASFEAFRFPERSYDLVNAQYALPFIAPDHFGRVFRAIIASLRPGGVFSGQLYGDQDGWVGTAGMTFHTKAEATELLSCLTLVDFEEENDPAGETASGKSKHWHAFHFIAVRDPQLR